MACSEFENSFTTLRDRMFGRVQSLTEMEDCSGADGLEGHGGPAPVRGWDRKSLGIRAIVILCWVLPLMMGRAQEIPYPVVLGLQRAADSAGKVEGVVCQLKMLHTREEDKRPFQVVVESPKGRLPVEVSLDGSFKLPLLPEGEGNRSKLVHNLEKGALSITFGFFVGGAIRAKGGEQRTIYAECSEIAGRLRQLEGVWAILGQVQPELNDLQLAIVGLSFPRSKPLHGRVLLKKKEATVQTVDLAETGQVVLMFDQYDPKVHTLDWSLVQEEGTTPPVEFIFRSGAEATGTKNAIFIRATKQGD